eukprot:120919_1
MEKQQKDLRRRAEKRMQRKKELRQHIKQNKKKHAASSDIQVDFVGNFDDDVASDQQNLTTETSSISQPNTAFDVKIDSLMNQSLKHLNIVTAEHEAELIRMQIEKEIGFPAFHKLYRQERSEEHT